jgi:carbon monoxide dehydrogenase subunit G
VTVAGSYTLGLPQDQAFALLQDPGVLAKCMPGCEALEPAGENEYRMKMKMALGAMKGLFEGKVKTAEQKPPDSFKLIVEGSGKIGFMKGEGTLTLTPLDSGTSVAYGGDVQVGGTIAAVGQRLIDTTAKLLIKRFFDRLAAEAGASPAGA